MFRVRKAQLVQFTDHHGEDYLTYDDFVSDVVVPEMVDWCLNELVWKQLSELLAAEAFTPILTGWNESIGPDLLPSLIEQAAELGAKGYSIMTICKSKYEFTSIAYMPDAIDIVDDKINPEACPGCGCQPGDGVSDDCEHPDGCGYMKQQEQNAADDGPYGRIV